MDATRAKTEQRQDSGRDETTLDNRYGKIGISAVAGAVRHKGERRGKAKEPRFDAYESD
jgi:hypothetical protein